MLRSMFRIFFALVAALSLSFGVFSGVGTALAASQTTTVGGDNPIISVPTDVSYCYPSGYNRNGWRCGWRLAMAPYNLGDYYRYGGYGYYGYGYYGYGYGYYGPSYYGYGYNSGICPPMYANGDYGGRPRFGCYYPVNPYYGPYYNPYYRPPY